MIRALKIQARLPLISVCVLGVWVIATLPAVMRNHTAYVHVCSPTTSQPPSNISDTISGRSKGKVSNVSTHLRCMDPEGKGLIQDTLCMARPKYLPTYKNPCWLDWSQDRLRLRCLPYFHVLGVDKCGTTDLHSRISQHPHVLLNNGIIKKEATYWSWLKYGKSHKKKRKLMAFSSYLKVFDGAAATISRKTDSDGFHSFITGDGTPMDFWDFRGWPLLPQNKGLSEPVVLTPHLMRHLYANPKFILIFRNPVDRLYSDYIFLQYGSTSKQFRSDASKAIAMVEKCMKTNTTRQCAFSDDLYNRLPARIHVGMYSVFMKEWLAVFPRSSFYIIRTEDYHKNTTYHLRNIFNFLDLKPLSTHEMKAIVDTALKYQTPSKKKAGSMHPDTRVQLNRFYARYNKELSAMLHDTGFLWLPSSRTIKVA